MRIDISIGKLAEYIEEYKSVKLINNNELSVNDCNITVPTPSGNATVNYIVKKTNLPMLQIKFDNSYIIEVANQHIFRQNNHDVYASDLHAGDYVDHINGPIMITDIVYIDNADCYDISIPAPYYYYDSNGVIHHNTLLTATLSRIIEPHGRSIVIVPSKSLVEQTEVDYKNLGLDVGVLYGDRKEYDRTHTICTWQSLNVLDKNCKDAFDDKQYEIFMHDLICVIVDECHILKADVVTRLMTDTFRHVPIRWGMTGTIPEEDQDKLSLLVSVGPNVGDLFASDLQAKGVLANCHVNVLQTKEVVKYNNYQEELKFLTTDRDRIKWMADMITAISAGGNTLVLCDRLETGKALEQLIEGSVFISGAVKSKDRKAEYDNIAVSDNQTLIATYGVAAVGINVPRLFNLVLIEPGKSFVRVIQSIGRGLRKAEDKDFVQIWDMTSTCKFSAKHLARRKQFYKQAQYPFSIEKIDRLT